MPVFFDAQCAARRIGPLHAVAASSQRRGRGSHVRGYVAYDDALPRPSDAAGRARWRRGTHTAHGTHTARAELSSAAPLAQGSQAWWAS